MVFTSFIYILFYNIFQNNARTLSKFVEKFDNIFKGDSKYALPLKKIMKNNKK